MSEKTCGTCDIIGMRADDRDRELAELRARIMELEDTLEEKEESWRWECERGVAYERKDQARIAELEGLNTDYHDRLSDQVARIAELEGALLSIYRMMTAWMPGSDQAVLQAIARVLPRPPEGENDNP